MTDHDFYLDISGTARELGRAHGEALRPTIHDTIGRWQVYLAEATGMSFSDLIARFLRDTDYRPAIERWAPHLLEEMRGIAEGAALDEELIYVWQLVDEIIDYVIEYVYIEKCSTVGGFNQGRELPPVLGKTQDLPPCYIGAGALVRTRYADSDVEILNSTIAGIICQDGMGPHLGVCLNHIGQLDRNPAGLPVSFVARILMERGNGVEQGVELLGSVSHASGMNYGLVDREQARTFEVSSSDTETQIAEFAPAPEQGRIWHTNHPLANNNYCKDIAMWNGLQDKEAGNTLKRAEFLQRELGVESKPVTLERVMDLLSSRETPISGEPGDEFPSINAMVMEFGESPTLYFAPGAPSQTEFHAFRFD